MLELAASAKLGKGESIVKQEERRKASKRVRMGLEKKVEERKSKALEEVRVVFPYIIEGYLLIFGNFVSGERFRKLPS